MPVTPVLDQDCRLRLHFFLRLAVLVFLRLGMNSALHRCAVSRLIVNVTGPISLGLCGSP